MPLYRASDPLPDHRPPRENTLVRINFYEALQHSPDHPMGMSYTIDRSKGTRRIVQRHARFYEKLTQAARPHHSPTQISFTMIKEDAADMLSKHGKSYKVLLRIAEELNPAERSQNLHTFVKHHDMIMHIFVQVEKNADLALKATQEDVLMNAERQLHFLLWSLSITQLWNSGDQNSGDQNSGDQNSGGQDTAHKLQGKVDLKFRSKIVVGLMKCEILENLVELDALLPHPNEVVVYENVGPDHDISSLGRTIPQAELSLLQAQLQLECPVTSSDNDNDTDGDHRIRCAICLDAYSINDRPFQLTECQHIIGRECMNAWLNSTHELATTCVHCRALLITRRPRCPKGQTEEQRRRIARLRRRIRKASYVLANTMSVMGTIWGLEGLRQSRENVHFWMNNELRNRGANFRLGHLLDNGMGWMFVRDTGVDD